MPPARAASTEPEQGAVAAQADQQVGPVDRDRTVGPRAEHRLVAPFGQPRRGPLGQRGRLRAVGVGIERDDGHGRSTASARSVRLGHGRVQQGRRATSAGAGPSSPAAGPGGAAAWTRNSMLPAEPVMGDGMAPMMSAPAAAERARHLAERPPVDVGVADDPSPRDASARPASNWGLTRRTTGAPGAATSPIRTGTARRSEMKERSAVTRSTGAPADRRQGDVPDVRAARS